MSPDQFQQIKNKIEQSTILAPDEKREWLFLLPKMNTDQIKELDRILSVHMPVVTQEHKEAIQDHKAAVQSHVASITEPRIRNPAPAGRQELGQKASKPQVQQTAAPVNDPGKLGTLTVKDLRLASSVYTFLEALATRLRVLVKNKLTTPDEITVAFEQSPLYRDYLDAGLTIMSGDEPSALGHHEIEAIADFRTSLKKILTN
ncbi:MAG: hypothetical protein U1C57_00815 [Candidatus Doudnabacteria bacterium]|nr:hypothetical protein [bacterium]MDZ4243627.1 hypothetical protein [Candidatus Doudnabacteria bacterium]